MAETRHSRLRHHFPSVTFVMALLAIIVLGVIAFIWFGIYNIAADAPHTRPVYAMIESLRDRSIAVHARSITAPADLQSAQHVSAGAGLYDEMCTGCHLGPGIEPSEMSQGLYPQAPDLAKHHDLTPAQQFIFLRANPICVGTGRLSPTGLTWEYRTRPTPLSREYLVRIAFDRGDV